MHPEGRPEYLKEQDLVDSFIKGLQEAGSPWGSVKVGSEFFYHSGRTDVVAVARDGQIIAFEAKLIRWRKALDQAYRNTCFAHCSYVLLPMAVAKKAGCFLNEFTRRKIGICYLDGAEVGVLYPAGRVEPLFPWLSERARAHVHPRELDAR